MHVMYVNVITPAMLVNVVLIKMLTSSAVVSMHSGAYNDGVYMLSIALFGILL